jgi:WD40 repeat protein
MSVTTRSQITPLDFEEDIRHLTTDFTGREWVLEDVDRWLKHDHQRFFILTGQPGVGKSAIAARLTQICPDIAAYHFCTAGRIDTIVPATVLRSLAAQLGKQLPGYGTALVNTIKPFHLTVEVNIDIEQMTGGEVTGVIIKHLYPSDPQQELDIMLRAPLAAMPEPDRPLAILIDSLDEAVTYRGDQNLAMLLAGLDGLPPWVRFICTTRPERRVMRYLEPLEPYVLAADAEPNLDDISRYIAVRAKRAKLQSRLAEAGVESQTLGRRLLDLSQGNFLYTRVLLDDIEADRQPLDDLSALPHSLDDIYHDFLCRFTVSEWTKRYQPLLAVLTVAQEPLTEAQLANFSGLQATQVRQHLGVLRQFLEARGAGVKETYRLFHQSFRDYLLDEERNRDFWCAPKDGHWRIADYFQRHYHEDWDNCGLYGLRHLPTHLFESKRLKRLRRLLFNFDWLCAKLSMTNASMMTTDYDLLPNDTEARLVQNALQLSTPGLREKDQLATQLTGRLLSKKSPSIQSLLGQIKRRMSKRTHLVPLTPSLHLPGGSLIGNFVGHESQVTSLVLIDDQDIVVSGDSSGTIKVWEISSYKELKTINAYSSSVIALVRVTNLNGDFIVSADSAGHLIVWDINTWSEAKHVKVRGPDIQRIVSSDDGSLAAVILSSGALVIWDFIQYKEIGWLRGTQDAFLARAYGGDVQAVAISANGQRLVSKKERGLIEFYDFENDHFSVLGADSVFDLVSAIELSPEGRYLFLGENVVDLDARGWHEIPLGEARYQVQRIAIARNKKVALIVDLGIGKLWDWIKQRELATINDMIPVGTLAISSDAKTILAASYDVIKIWQVQELSPHFEQRHSRHSGPILWIARMPKQPILVTASYDGTLKIWDSEDCTEIGSLIGHSEEWWVAAAVPTSDGKRLVSVGADQTLRIWDIAEARQIKSIELGFNFPASVAICKHTGLAVIGFQQGFGKAGSLELWDLEQGIKKEVLMDSGGWRGLALSKDQHLAFCGSQTGEILVINLQDNSIRERITAHEDGVYSVSTTTVDEIIVSGGGDGAVRIWNWQTRNLIREIHGHTARVYATSVAPEGDYIVSASEDCNLKIWDFSNGNCLASFRNDVGITACLVLDDKGKIVAGDDAGLLRFFSLERS